MMMGMVESNQAKMKEMNGKNMCFVVLLYGSQYTKLASTVELLSLAELIVDSKRW